MIIDYCYKLYILHEQVCMRTNKSEEAQCWIILKLLLCGMTPGCSTLGLLQITDSSCSEGGSVVNNVNVCVCKYINLYN